MRLLAETETFWTLLHSTGHWEFEAFLMVLFDGLLAGVTWPLIKMAVRKHDAKKHLKSCDHESLSNGYLKNSNNLPNSEFE